MPTTVPSATVRSQLNGLRATEAKGRTVANPLEQSALLPLIRQAMRETELSQKAMALNAGQPESVISDGLNGRRHFAAEWWWTQPDTFLIRFLDLVSAARQLTPENASAARPRRIVELVDLLLTECA